jgi:hypothetical protein
MAQNRIPAGRKRLTITVDEKKLNRFLSLCREFGMPNTTVSSVCNDALHEIANVLQAAKTQGTFGITDVFKLMGKQVELIMEEERKSNDQNKKRDTTFDRQVSE